MSWMGSCWAGEVRAVVGSLSAGAEWAFGAEATEHQKNSGTSRVRSTTTQDQTASTAEVGMEPGRTESGFVLNA